MIERSLVCVSMELDDNKALELNLTKALEIQHVTGRFQYRMRMHIKTTRHVLFAGWRADSIVVRDIMWGSPPQQVFKFTQEN